MMSTKNLRLAAIGLLVLGLALVGFFGWRTLHAARDFHGHRPPFPPPAPGKIETDVELIRDWMTVPFVAHQYHVPGIVIFETLKIDPQGNDKKSLAELNREYFPNDSNFVITTVKEAVRANQPPTPETQSAPPATPQP